MIFAVNCQVKILYEDLERNVCQFKTQFCSWFFPDCLTHIFKIHETLKKYSLFSIAFRMIGSFSHFKRYSVKINDQTL